MASLDELKKKYLPQHTTQTTPVRNEAEPRSAAPAGNDSESYLDRLKKKYIPTVDQDYINSFMTDADSFLGSAQSDYESMGIDTYSKIHDERLQKSNDLRKKSFAIRRYLDDNKDAIGEEQYNSFKDYLDSFDKTAGDIGYQFYNASQYYSGEKQRYDIDNMSSRDLKAHLSDDSPIAYTTSDGKNVTWQNLYDKKVKEESAQALYSSISGKADFKNAVRTAKYYQNPTSGEVDNAVVVFGKRIGGTTKPVNKVSYYESNADMIAFGEANGGGSSIVHSRMRTMTEQEKDIYHYYFGIGAYEEADAYLASLQDDLQTRFEAQELERTAEFAKEHPVLASGVSVGTNIASAAETLRDLFDFAAKKDLGRDHAADMTNMIRGTVSDEVDWEIGNWDAFDFLYNTTMSGVDSFVNGAAFGGAGAAVLGLSAAAQGVNDALDRGMTDGQAFWNGLASGVFEGVFEKISLGNLKSLKELPVNEVKDLAKNIAKSMLVNASEEMLTEIANITYDSLLNGDLSAYETAVRQYMDAGMSESQARAKTRGDFVLRVVEAAASGGLMGAGFGAIGSAAGTANTNDLMKKQYGGAEKELVAEALEINPDNAYAKKVEARLDRGKSATGNQIRKLVYQNETAMTAQDRANIKQAAEARLTELGEVDGVSELAQILSKQAAGQELTRAERRALESSRYGKRVANELSPENIRSGEYTSGWAQGIKTNRINVDEYNRMIEAAQTAQEAETPMEAQEVTEAENAMQAQDLPPAEAPAEVAKDVATANEVPAAEIVEAAETEEDAEPAVTLDAASTKYGAQAGAMMHTYVQGQDVAKYDRAYGSAYDMGKSGVNLSYAMNSASTAYLTEQQRELAYAAGKAASDTSAREQAEKNAKAANGKTGRKRGVVRGEGVNIADLRKNFNDTQGTAYKVLSTYAEATGIDIVLYKSEANADGDFEGAQGKFKWSEDTIYIDINAGLANVKSVNDLAKYAMLRTFSHEFTHFLEKWNPVRYNEFRRVVFDALTERGENVHDLIEEKMAQNTGMEYDAASREVVAEAMTDILPDTTFVHTLAEKHKSIFDKLLERLKEFAADLKKYFSTIGHNRDRGANALKEQVGEAVKYVDSIVKLFDEVAVEAVENYRRTVATEEVAVDQPDEDVPDPHGLTDGEKTALMVYKSGGSYTLNAKLREGVILDEYEQYIVDNLVNALEKLPVYKGKVYRNIMFDGWGNQAARDAFVRSHVIGEWITYEGFTSTSTAVDGYPLDGDFVVHMEIESMNGRDLSGYGNNFESEVLLTHPSQFIPNKIEYTADGTPTIYLTEVAYGQEETKPQTAHGGGNQGDVSRDHSGESRQREASDIPNQGEVQRLHTSHSGDGEVQPAVPERDTVGNRDKQGDLQGVQAEVSTTEGDGDAFTITDNHEYGTLEIKFDGKPAETIREVLKAHKFRWHGKKGIWYGKAERADIVRALREAYQAEDTAKEPEVKKPSDFETAFWNATQEERDEVIDAINENTKLTHMRPTELRGETPTNIEEVTEHVETEHADNGRSVLEPDTDGQGTARLLDESQDGDVSGAAPQRETVGDAGQREPAPASDGDRPDAGAGDSRSEGSGESGDLRRDEVSAEEVAAAAEQLQATVEEQIEQKSTEEPKGSNFVIGDSLNLPDGEKARFHANVAAIRLIKQLESEGRYATASEQEVLSKYIGWGGLDKAFGEYRFNRETRKSEMAAKDGWEKEFAELRSLVDEGIVTEQEYKDMSASTKNAHYTSIEVIKAMYDGLAGLGFKGGRMLEPSSGVGNFVGAMPASMTERVNSWTMVELDRVTGLIAKYLYPNADVRIQGFETANIPDNYMDVAIGNVPFGNFGVVDRAYPKRITKAIHNYFFAKSIDKVRPGGIVMFITSSFTMNASDTTVRQYIMDRADLLGAIRLPNTAFKGNAGTEVVTDILILKKRESGTAYSGEDFLSADYDSNYGTYTSNYFKNHPEMVLGKPVVKRGMYGSGTLTFEPFTDRGTIDEQIREAFKHIKGEMSYPAQRTPEKTNFAVEKAGKKSKAGGYVVHADGSISQNRNGQLVKVDTDEKTAKRIAGMLGIRDAYKTLANYLQQGVEAKYIKQARTALNKAYDAFVAEYGYLNSPANRKAIDSDPDSYSILSLENFDPKKKTAKKADIFTKDTISANKTITHVDSVGEGVIASINLTGGVDVDLISRLTDRTVEDVTREIIESRVAFKTRGGALVARESYLSGNVRAKLREAEALLPFDKDYAHNVEELRRVIPADIPYNEIYITPGNAFIPNEVYADFIAHMLGGRNNASSYSGPDVEVGRTASGDFKIVVNNKRLKNSHYNTQTWGTARKSFLDLIDAMMGSRSIRVNDTMESADGKKISVLNEAETEAANEKAKAIQKEFEDWVWQDEERRTALARLYNETFNAIVNPKFDGSHLSVNGINADFSLRPHQANAVHRIIASGGNTLLAHRVGAGKTLEMAAAAMKLRELGVVKKPVFVVPKSLVAQWGVEFHSYFPASRLLVADDKSFTPANRRIFTNKIANGDFDAVIVSYEQFEKIPMSVEYQQRFYEEQIDEIIAAIAEEKAESRDGKGMTVKEMEKKKAQLEKKLKELTSKPKDDDNVNFEMLGIDSLFVDEAHNFKNLEYVSKMSNVAGLGSAKGSQRAFDLYTKIRYLQGLNGGRGIVFATATPVMNSMVELYIMQKYLQPDILDRLGLKSFDAWAKQFGEVVNKWEINPSGTGMRQKQVFANFRNLNELQLLFRSFSDVLTEVPGLKIPKMKGGAVKIVECEPGEFQKNFMQELQKRAENVKNVDPSVDNMLKITSDGRKVSYTQRMIDPTLPYEPGSKIFRAADNVLEEYKASADIKGTQIVFLDMATPKGSDKSKTDAAGEDTTDEDYDEESARLYDDMRDYLVKKGIPRKEIAFIHEADSDAKRKQLFEDVNNGKVRVLIGSTGKMGVGMNAQKRIVAIHHLDAPWRPGDVEQRDGRAFRQKNMNEEVSKYVYVTKGSFDSRLWDILDRKQHFINQIMNGEDVGRTAEDTGEVTLSAAEVKALASGNPLIEEQTKLTDEIKKLENLLKAYHSSIRLAKTKLSDDEQNIAFHKNRIEHIREDIKARVDTYSEGKFSMTVGGKVYTDKKDAGMALLTEIMAKAGKDAYVTVGQFAGFELKAIRNGAEFSGLIHGKGSYKFNVYVSNTTRMVGHIGEVIAGFENMIKNSEQVIADATSDRAVQQEILAKPFEKQDELAAKRARFNEVMEQLTPKTEQQLGNEVEQEQSRAYLGEQEQQRTDTLTDRDVLALAAREIRVDNLSAGEQDALRIFRERLSRLETLEEERAEQGRLYKEQQFGAKPDRAAAEATLNRMHVLDSQIAKASTEVLDVEDKKVLKTVLQKARKVVETEERAHGQEMLARWRDRRNNAAAIKKYRERLRGDVDDLTNWVLHPDNKDIVKRIPDALKNSVIPFLSSINFMSKRSLKGGAATKADEAFKATFEKLNSVLVSQTAPYGQSYSDYVDLPPGFMENMQTYIKAVNALVDKKSGELVINQMTSEELKELSRIVKTLKKYIMQFNRFHANAMFQHVYEAGDSTIREVGMMASDKGTTGWVDNFFDFQNTRPAYVWERFGEAATAIRDELQEGQSQYGFNVKKIEEFTKKAYTTKEVQAWRSATKTFRIGGDTVEMRISHMMGLYLLSKQPDSLRHMLGGGVRVASFKKGGKNIKPITDIGHILTQSDINTIVNQLTPRQKEVADKLQKFMAEQGGEWGNYVSVKRFGEKLFTNPLYYPIHADGQVLSGNVEEFPAGASLYELLNMSFTKSRDEKADNRIILYDVFDEFSSHMSSMAQYNALALPVLDATKWLNYQMKSEPDENGRRAVLGGVREQLTRVFGAPNESEDGQTGKGKNGYAVTFIENILKDFNGTNAQGTPYDGAYMKILHNANRAKVAMNLRSSLLQPTAIVRAGFILDVRSILKGMNLTDLKNNEEEMLKYSGIAVWKNLGFYDVNVSRGMHEIITHDTSWRDKVTEKGLWLSETLDRLTWSAIWGAAKKDVMRKQKMHPESEGFYEAVAKVFEEVIYKTQVVDSVLTKTELMRSKSPIARTAASFMGEPVTSVSMLLDAHEKVKRDARRFGLGESIKRNKMHLTRAWSTYAVNALVTAIVGALVADAWRDDDEYEAWWEKILEAINSNIWGELDPLMKIPYVADVWEAFTSVFKTIHNSLFGTDFQSYSQESAIGEITNELTKFVEILLDKAKGEDTRYTKYAAVYYFMRAASSISGLPFATTLREAATIWNNSFGKIYPELKLQTYDPGDKNEIRYAYEDGHLSAEEATEQLLAKGLVDNEDEAYFTIAGWEAGEGYSRYDAIYDAVRNGGNVNEALAELTSHGYTEEDVFSQVKGQIGKWYRDGEISKAQATEMLTKYARYFKMDSDEITATVNKWSAKVVTGIDFEDIGDEYEAGKITASRAIEMYVRYGGYTREEAQQKITLIDFVKKHPTLEGISYAAVESYKEHAEGAGISAETFYDVWKYNSETQADVDASGKAISGSKKDKVLAYIHSLGLTRAQKDSLYYAFGWAQSKINEAPWR